MILRATSRICILFLILSGVFPFQVFAAETFYFGVLNQRSVILTAQLWNPVLHYVSAKSGVPLTIENG